MAEQKAPPPILETLGEDDSQVKIVHTSTQRKSNNTKKVQHIPIQVKLESVEGVPMLKLKEGDGKWQLASRPLFSKYRKHVVQEVLQLLFGIDHQKKNRKELDALLFAAAGLELDAQGLIDALFDDSMKATIFKKLKMEKTVLLFDIKEEISAYRDGILDISPFVRDVFQALWDSKADDLDGFCAFIWDSLTEIWRAHPDDVSFTGATIAFTNEFGDSEEFTKLKSSFDELFDDKPFRTFAYAMFICTNRIFIHEVAKLVLECGKALSSGILGTGRKLDAEELFYLHQSMGGATANSKLRVYYGGNFRAHTKAMLIIIIRSMILTDATLPHAKVAFRLRIENRGYLRILNGPCTEWVGEVMNLIKPYLQNLVLLSGGKFDKILASILGNDSLKDRWLKLFNQGHLIGKYELYMKDHASDKENDEEKNQQPADLIGFCEENLEKVYLDFVRGVFNRCIWGYLKPLAPTKETLSLRNKLKLSLSTTKRQMSSLQINND